MKKHALRMAIGLVIMLLFLSNWAGIIQLPLVKQMELWSYDWRLKATMPGGQDRQVVIVDIDEKSLAEIGRWPWSRNVIARMMDQLFDKYGVAAVGFDVVFAEPDTSSGIRELEGLAKKELRQNVEFQKALSRSRARLDYDTLLASRFKGRPVVLGYYFNEDQEKGGTRRGGMLPQPALKDANLEARSAIRSKKGYGANLPVLQKAASSGGHFNPDPDQDGVTRRVPMLARYDGVYYESLALALLRTLYGQPEIKAGIGADGLLGWLEVADLKIPVDYGGSALIPYRGGQGSFLYISAADILKNRASKELLEGAIILVGTTAPGLMDLRSTPVSPVYPGVEIHANMIAGIQDKTLRHAPAYSKTYEFFLLIVLGIFLSIILPRMGALPSMGIAIVVAGAVTGVNLVAWNRLLVLPLASPLFMTALLYVMNATWGFLVEARAKHHITGLFGQYVPPQIVSKMSRDPQNFTMAAEERDMTVLFTDVVGFTTISEALEPKVLAQVMNIYLSAMTEVIYQHGGTVDKYIGDAIMAFWGAPIDDHDHALHAIQAGLAMRKRMDLIRADFAQKGLPELRIGIGINSGHMRVGNMGSSFRVAYTVMGDAVNLASRLEGITRQYGAWMVAGVETVRRVKGIAFTELDLVKVKGKNEPVAIFEPCGIEGELTEETAARMQKMDQFLKAYRGQDWDLAESLLSEIEEKYDRKRMGDLFRPRIEEFREHSPGEGWDGVCKFTTK